MSKTPKNEFLNKPPIELKVYIIIPDNIPEDVLNTYNITAKLNRASAERFVLENPGYRFVKVRANKV